jgi:hypothetical protein
VYITQYDPPEARVRYVEGGIELKFTEAAVMLAFAFHLLEQAEDEAEVFIHPDGEHAKVFDVADFLVRRGFQKTKVIGKTPYGGRYANGHHAITVKPTSGLGDVVAVVNGQRVIAECKGGTINSSHPGQKSRLRKGLSELIGQLMILPQGDERQIAVLPHTTEIERLALKMKDRCLSAGVEIALVHRDGEVTFV